MASPRFLPPRDMSDKHLANTQGHSFVVYPVDPVDGLAGTCVPERFRRDAVAEGCLIVGVDDHDSSSNGGPIDEKQVLIVEAITRIMERDDGDELDGEGNPKLDAVKKEAGFGVTKKQMTDALAVFIESLG